MIYINIEKKDTIKNSVSANEKLSSVSSIISENATANTGNTSLINCTDFNVNGNTLKNSAKILDKN